MRIVNGTAIRYDLWLRDAEGSATSLTISQTSIAGSPFSIPLILTENNSGGFLLRIHAESSAQVPANENVGHFMHSFVLTQTIAQTSGTQNIIAASYYGFEGTGPLTDPGYGTRFASVDNNQLIRHVFLYQEWNNPVIRITNTPEPTTAAMLLALALLLRRRRVNQPANHAVNPPCHGSCQKAPSGI
ncbi:MAG: PEP-CTERM sorting domain-containing protein [Planctomycetia bacterium]|nr:MAG: PEP-CTERM sorting domain-containing protein [Planctomycetia bacterium]